MLDSTFVIKNNELCFIGSEVVRSGMREGGLFLRDTRFLSSFEWRIESRVCDLLDIRQISEREIILSLANPTLPLGDIALRPHTLGIQHRVRLDTGLCMDLEITNYGLDQVRVQPEILVGSDFQDMFTVRGLSPGSRASPQQPMEIEPGCVRLFTADGTEALPELTIISTPPPAQTSGSVRTSDDAVPEATASLTYDLTIESQGSVALRLDLRPLMVGPEPLPTSSFGSVEGFEARLDVSTENEFFDEFISRCDRDLAMLFTSFPDGRITAAGIPWFIAPFGRDSLIVALQTMHAYPERSDATLRTLASLQGTEKNAYREEEPGKILHEMRYGHLAQTHQIPHSPYYGSVDSTPLFVMTFAEHMRWYPDDPLYEDLLPYVERALQWIERSRTTSGDGLLTFGGIAQGFAHIGQQGWKDSADSLHFANGDAVKGPIALVEVQGYVYAAYAWLAAVVEARGNNEWAHDLRNVADEMRTIVEARFWLEEANFYAQALDGKGRAVDAISSNPGHLLFCGLPSAERAARVAARLGEPDMLCPWGVRTLSSAMATYNPMSYHNGSTWPHDSSLAMAGLMRYGHEELARDIADRLVATSRFDQEWRLDELYCGFGDHPEAGPVKYPVSCRPQAWAAGAGLLAHRTLFGIEPGD